jgi:hypothetical protein
MRIRPSALPILLALTACDFASDSRTGPAQGGENDADAGVDPGVGPECPGYGGAGMVCLGSFEVRNFADLDVLAPCARVTGDLDLGADGLVDIQLPLLERVDGDVTVQPSDSLATISMPELKEIGGNVTRGFLTPVLASLEVPRLVSVAGSVFLEDGGDPIADVDVECLTAVGGDLAPGAPLVAPHLATVGGDLGAAISAPLLTEVGGELSYQQGADLPALARVGALVLTRTDAISLPSLVSVTGIARFCPVATTMAPTLALPALVRVGALRICPWPALISIDMPALRRVTGPGTLGGLNLGAAIGVPSVSFPALLSIVGTGTFSIPTTMDALTTAGVMLVNAPVGAPALTTASRITLNAPLAAAALEEVSGTLTSNFQSISFPVLLSAGAIKSNASVSVPALTAVTDFVALTGTGAFDAGALRTVGGYLRIVRPGSAEPIALGSLETVGRFVTLTGLAASPVDLPSLLSVGGDFRLSDTGAVELTAPALTSIGEDLTIQDNDSLGQIDFSSLASLDNNLQVVRNPSLPNCQATDLEAQLRAAGWTGTADIRLNGTGTCP